MTFFQLQCVIMDFEPAIWNAFQDMVPNITRKGYHFHWTQAIWRKVQDLGLTASYTSDLSVQKFIHRLMCLLFLPHEHIILLFTNMILVDKPTSPMPPLLHQPLNYIQTNWIFSNIWPPASWSIFNHAVKINNDREGWHRHLYAKEL